MTPPHKTELKAATPPRPQTRLTHIGLRRYSAAEFLIALVLLIVAAPFVEDIKGGSFIESVLMTLVLASGALAVGRRRSILWVAVILGGPAVAAKWINHLRPDVVPQEFFLATGLIFAVFIIIQLLRFILRAPRVNSEVLCASLSAYLMLGLCWMFAYLVLARAAPDSFAFNAGPVSRRSMDGFTGFYFSFSTLSTVGYGDITPVSNVARMLAVMESMTGTLFVAVLIARLVSIYSSNPPPDAGHRSL